MAGANPYLNRLPVREPDRFFGRRRELRRIVEGLAGERAQSFSLVGDRRIGKSSLLQQVLRAHREGRIGSPEATVVRFHDFQASCPTGPEDFQGFLRAELRGIADIDEALSAPIERAGRRVVFVWDEFEVPLRRGVFDAPLLERMRAWAGGGAVAFVAATGRDLQALCNPRALAGSSFFNVFHLVALGPLDDAAATELIARPSRDAGLPLAEHGGRLLRLAGRLPLFLQMACTAAFEYLADLPEGAEPDWEEIADRFFEEARPHLRHLVADELTPQEVEACRRVAGAAAVGAELAPALRSLRRRGYLVPRDGGHAPFTPFLADVLPDTGPVQADRTGVRRLLAAIRACNDILGTHGRPLAFEAVPDLFDLGDLLDPPHDEATLRARVDLLWKIAFESTHAAGPRSASGSRLPDAVRRDYYRSHAVSALVCLRNFWSHAKVALDPDAPSGRYTNAGEVFARYLPDARRYPASPQDWATAFAGLLDDLCARVESLAAALRAAAARGEMRP